jgi:prophage regulatory protein
MSHDKFLRLNRIINGDPNAEPPIDPIVPVCRATFYAGIEKGIYPPPIKLSPRVSVWRASEIYALVNGAPFNPENKQK